MDIALRLVARRGAAHVPLVLVSVMTACSGGPAEVRVEARAAGAGYAFVPASVQAPSQSRVMVTLHNASDAPHTLVLLEPIDRRSGTIVEPGNSDRLELVTPAAGSYRFVCTVHADMSGTLLVEDR